MNKDEEIKTLVQRILNSKDFKDSPVYKNLLLYLYEATVSNQIPKEITIAIDVFGKDSHFNSYKDSTVRYHVYILRKKLENYYKNEGKGDNKRLFIPKGHYEINFIKVKKFKPVQLIAFLRRWEILVNIVLLGDDFLLDEYNSQFQRYRQIRDWEIDSESDLYDFLIQYPNANLRKSEITGIPFGGINNLLDVLPIVYQFQREIFVKMSSTLTLEEIRNHNIIYIGEFKNLRILNQILHKTPIRYQYRPDERLFILDGKGDTLNTFQRIEAPYEQSDKYNIDYSLLIKIPGFIDENFMFIVGFGYGGRIERTKMLADCSKNESKKTFLYKQEILDEVQDFILFTFLFYLNGGCPEIRL
ncbi:hypothetical protein JW935_12450 [candidate division KSB1 bacterium]|nr:hypothetical protein [candidate division KSB1 bacterium]